MQSNSVTAVPVCKDFVVTTFQTPNAAFKQLYPQISACTHKCQPLGVCVPSNKNMSGHAETAGILLSNLTTNKQEIGIIFQVVDFLQLACKEFSIYGDEHLSMAYFWKLSRVTAYVIE